ncbi:MAG: enoyl-CoA hydratase/isomerase family protein [Deltaproteobacteria bacterium]|nr:enoyl-CoA hydratase/isomerase family protein [Deltaproteobacteria bacterium]
MKGVLLASRDRVAKITLNRPEKLNALNSRMNSELIEAVDQVERDDTLRVVILTGAGDRAFCSGSDLTELRETAPLELRRRIEAANTIRKITKPVIAMIRGYALGGGLELALACDIRIASEDAQLGFPEVRLGWLPGGGGGTQVLGRLVGEGMAMKLILSGRPIPAVEAKRIGLVEEVVTPDLLESETEKLARQIAENPLEVLRLAKEAVRASIHTNLHARLDYERALNALCFHLRGQEERRAPGGSAEGG